MKRGKPGRVYNCFWRHVAAPAAVSGRLSSERVVTTKGKEAEIVMMGWVSSAPSGLGLGLGFFFYLK
jgi:hypothetical protein